LFFIGEVVSLYGAGEINPLLREFIPFANEDYPVAVHA
jgi:hypothetical protein